MNYAFLYHMKMVSAKLKIVTFKAPVTVSVMTMAYTRPRHECIEIDFIQQIMLFFVMK